MAFQVGTNTIVKIKASARSRCENTRENLQRAFMHDKIWNREDIDKQDIIQAIQGVAKKCTN